MYKRELEEWGSRSDVKMVTTVDPGGETPDWTGEVGYVTPVVEKTAPKADNAVAVVCGPPIVVKLTLPVLEKLGFADDAIFTTLENRMKCGLGKCGRCNIGPVYVCKDGPVFTAAQMKAAPAGVLSRLRFAGRPLYVPAASGSEPWARDRTPADASAATTRVRSLCSDIWPAARDTIRCASPGPASGKRSRMPARSSSRVSSVNSNDLRRRCSGVIRRSASTYIR